MNGRAKTQMQKMGFILNITENKHKSNHPEGENQNLYKNTLGISMSLLPFWALNVVIALLSMEDQKALRVHQKCLNLCS